MRQFYSIIIVTLAVALGGCATVPDSIIQQPLTARPQAAVAQPPANGAIFQSAAYRPMFEDHRARLVGDTMTIAIVEKTSAGKSAGNSASKTGSTDYSVGALFGVPASTLAKAGISSSTANKFEEKG